MTIEEYRDRIISSKFYENYPADVARQVLGKYLVRVIDGVILVGKIVETEAYLPFGDDAAHNARGKTRRNRSLFQSAGRAYVHTMRQYCLLDIVAEGTDDPGSVLIRAVEPIEGIEIMKTNRCTDKLLKLCSGPGKLCQAFAITRDFDGFDMTSRDAILFTADCNAPIPMDQIVASTRIGISKAKDKLLRFTIKDSPFISHPS